MAASKSTPMNADKGILFMSISDLLWRTDNEWRIIMAVSNDAAGSCQ
jgi:hypothetical protein